MEEVAVETWPEFEHCLRAVIEQNQRSFVPLLFRGQVDAQWDAKTTLERAANAGTSVREYYSKVLRISPQVATSLMAMAPREVEAELVGIDWDDYEALSGMIRLGRLPAEDLVVFLRHHGFPSPLLDWSRSKYVAAYFAFSPSEPQRRSLFVFADSPDNMKLGSSDRPGIHVVGARSTGTPRHFLQQSAYTVCMGHSLDRTPAFQWSFVPHQSAFQQPTPVAEEAVQDVLWKFIFPADIRDKILRELDEHNLNDFSLFASPESMMRTLAMREFDLQKPYALRTSATGVGR